MPSASPPCDLTVADGNGLPSIEVEAELRRGYDVLENWTMDSATKGEEIFALRSSGRDTFRLRGQPWTRR